MTPPMTPPDDAGLVERLPSNAAMIAELQATALMFRMFSMEELRSMQVTLPNPPAQEEGR